MYKEKLSLYNNQEEDADLLKKGRDLLNNLEKHSEKITDSELKAKMIEIEELMIDLKNTKERDYIELVGRAVSVFRKIGKQYEAEELIKENMERFKNL